MLLPVTGLYASHMYIPLFSRAGFSIIYFSVLTLVSVPLNFQVKLAGGTDGAEQVSVTGWFSSTFLTPVTVACSGPSAPKKKEGSLCGLKKKRITTVVKGH